MHPELDLSRFPTRGMKQRGERALHRGTILRMRSLDQVIQRQSLFVDQIEETPRGLGAENFPGRRVDLADADAGSFCREAQELRRLLQPPFRFLLLRRVT
jgi:hypothetical protein